MQTFIVRLNGRHYIVEALCASAASKLAAEHLECWPGEAEVWTLGYCRARYGDLPELVRL